MLPEKYVTTDDIMGTDWKEIDRQMRELASQYKITFAFFPKDIRDGVDPKVATGVDIKRSSSYLQYAYDAFLFYGEGLSKYKIIKSRGPFPKKVLDIS